MEKFRRISGKLIICACEAAVGVILLVNPEGFTKIMVTAAGILFCVLGALAGIRYFRTEPEDAALTQDLTKGLVALSVGFFLIYRADWIMNSFMPVTVFYGIAALLTGVVKLQWTVDMIRLKRGLWQSSAIAAVLSIIVAVIVFASPFKARKTLWTVTAIVLIVAAIVDGVAAVTSQIERKKEEKDRERDKNTEKD